jgi:methylated-DNA-[protein]-cysteine S-methyltransferase
MSQYFEQTIDLPTGALRLVASETALIGAWWPGQRIPVETIHSTSHALLNQAIRQLREYFAGQRNAFDIPLEPMGTEFQRSVWQALRTIPYGETRSYSQIAAQVGRPSAVRAIGATNGRNPLSIFIPCHRVIGANGSLTGYAGGLPAKEWLLSHERQNSPGKPA